MFSDLDDNGIKEPEMALNWWNKVETSTVSEVKKITVLYATLFIDAS